MEGSTHLAMDPHLCEIDGKHTNFDFEVPMLKQEELYVRGLDHRHTPCK